MNSPAHVESQTAGRVTVRPGTVFPPTQKVPKLASRAWHSAVSAATAAGSSGRASHELPMAQSELLKRMPESVVRDGVVVDVRRVIAEHLAAAGGGVGSASADAARRRAERDVVRAKRLAALGAK